MNGITKQIAEFATGAAPVSATARQMARLSLLDWAACGIAGQNEPVAQIVRNMVLAEEGRGAASLFGSGRAPVRGAALVNGTVSHALDFDDTHFAHIGHPSVAVYPSALATAEQTGASEQALLDAALIGLEVSIRAGVWLGRDHYQLGFHQTATAGAFGATAAAGRLLELGQEQMEHALGLVATKAAGLKSQFGTMGKPYNAGIAAASGVEAAMLAHAGFVSRPDGLECEQGFGSTHSGADDLTAIEGLGQTWMFETVSHKFHACCHGTHAMIEALQKQCDLDPDSIKAIRVDTHPRWLSVCNLAKPATGLEAKFSYPLIAAMVARGVDTAALASFSDEITRDTKLKALRDRLEVQADVSLSEMQCRVQIDLDTGEHVILEHDLAAEITLDQRQKKLIHKVNSLLGDQADALISACLRDVPDLAGLTALMSGQ